MVFGLLSTFMMPSKFYNDAIIIVNDYYNEIGLFGGYPFTILFYHITLLKHLPYFLIALIQIPILFYLIYKIGIPDSLNQFTLKNIAIIYGLLFLGAFTSIPSKEFINFIVIGWVVLLFKNKNYPLLKTVIFAFGIFILTGIFFRPYYIIIPLLSSFMFVLTYYIKLQNKTIKILLYSFLMSVLLSLSHGLIKGEYISESTREAHNEERMGSSEAQTMILSPIESDTWYGESFAVFYGYVSINIPFNGFKYYTKPQVIAFILWQLSLFYILLIGLNKCVSNREEYKYEIWIFYFVFSYFVIQGLFEPDLGSAFRHKVGILPLIYFAFYHTQLARKDNVSA